MRQSLFVSLENLSTKDDIPWILTRSCEALMVIERRLKVISVISVGCTPGGIGIDVGTAGCAGVGVTGLSVLLRILYFPLYSSEVRCNA